LLLSGPFPLVPRKVRDGRVPSRRRGTVPVQKQQVRPGAGVGNCRELSPSQRLLLSLGQEPPDSAVNQSAGLAPASPSPSPRLRPTTWPFSVADKISPCARRPVTVCQRVPQALAWEMTGESAALCPTSGCTVHRGAAGSGGGRHSLLLRHRPQLPPLLMSPRADGPLASPRAGTPFDNTQCRACPRGFFSSSNSSTKPCQPHQDCEQQGKETNVQGNQYHDTLCTSCRLGRSNSTQGPGEPRAGGRDAGTTMLPGPEPTFF